jgi:anti-sigma B factor antagonist
MSSSHVEFKSVGDVTVAKITSPRLVDDMMIHEAFNAILAYIQDGSERLVIDFDLVQFLSSSALGKLISLSKAMKKNEGSLVICCVNNSIWKAFEMTGLSKKFPRYSTEMHAIANL